MEHSNFTYVFEDDRVLAFNGRSVIASASSLEELEAKLATEAGDCPTCNGTGKKGADNTACSACGGTGKIRSAESSAKTAEEDTDGACQKCGHRGATNGDGLCADCQDGDDRDKTANVVVTPNGLRGKIMGRAKNIWGDTVTVRFDNGNIRELPVTAALKFASEEEAPEADPLDALRERFEASYSQTKEGLVARQAELAAIKNEGRHIAATRREAADILVQADYEAREIAEALEHISSVEAVAPPKREWAAYEQASVGRSSSWIDSVYDDMQREAAGTDFDALMSEGPEAFVAGLEDAVIADVPTVRDLVTSHLAPKIAMADKEIRDQFEDVFQARVEAVRRQAVSSRKSSVQQKQAKIEEDISGAPDEALFG